MMIRENEFGNVDIKSMADKVSVQDGMKTSHVRSFVRCLVGRSESGTKKLSKKVPFAFLSILRIIKPIYDDVPNPSTLQKSLSGVF